MNNKLDFKQVGNIIFKNHSNWNVVTDEDKINAYFILNQKFSSVYPAIAKQFNDKNIDKASVMDLWFEFFSKKFVDIPKWYWNTSRKKSNKIIKKLRQDDIKILKRYYDLSDSDFEYLYKNFESELLSELENIKRIEGK